MKSLLLKDWYVLCKQLRWMLAFIVIFSLIPGSSISALAAVYGAMLPYSAMAFDERCKWDRLAAMLPYSARDLVLSKYLLGWIGSLIATVCSLLAGVVFSLLGKADFSLSGPAMGLILSLFVMTITLPLMFRFGVEKSRLMYFLIIGIIAGTIGFGISLLSNDGIQVSGLDRGLLGLSPVYSIPLGILILLNLLTIPLSIRFYSRRDF